MRLTHKYVQKKTQDRYCWSMAHYCSGSERVDGIDEHQHVGSAQRQSHQVMHPQRRHPWKEGALVWMQELMHANTFVPSVPECSRSLSGSHLFNTHVRIILSGGGRSSFHDSASFRAAACCWHCSACKSGRGRCQCYAGAGLTPNNDAVL